MAKIIWAPGIEVVSGALTKIKTKSSHADDGNMFLATHRTAATMSTSCSRSYYRKINNLPWQSGQPVSTEVLTQRGDFGMKAKAVSTRRKDLNKMGPDNKAFRDLNAEYEQKTGRKGTINVFYWAAAKKYTPEGEHTPTWPSGAIELSYEEFASACNSARK